MIYPLSGRTAQRGVGLLEVLIALLVLAVGVLGFAGLQMTALNQSDEANHRAAAVLIAQDAIERFELNPGKREAYWAANWNAGTVGATPPGTCVDPAEACTADQVVAWDIAQLSWQAANLLPGGRVTASDCEFNNLLTCVVVSWDEQDPAECMNNDGILVAADSRCFVMEIAR
ncbi:type IV pilus modification protein PilV [Pseudomonas sp. FME51]|uniref:type IV pilus modification protein PilV n=1 Tax=Pseudomonas sp. FME51 TaxID=2742609 RepID=UPI001866859A|nr:type IV pilus modification protein PilV [Pseudomonas sp. FME51]